VVHYVLTALRTAGASRLIAVVGHQEADVRKAVTAAWPCEAPHGGAKQGVDFVRQTDQKGTGHAVLCCKAALDGFDGDVVVLAGDAPLVRGETLAAMIQAHRLEKNSCTVLTACVDNPAGYGRILRDKEGRFLRIVEEADAADAEKYVQEVNSGTYVFRAADLFDTLRDVKPDNKKGEYYLTDVLALLLKKDRRVSTYKAADPSEVYGVNSRQDLVAATNFLRWRVLEKHLSSGVTIVDPATTYIEEGVTIGQDAVILPFSVIEHDVVVGAHCEVGPFAHLRPGTVLDEHAEIGNFVEVKKSRVGPHSKAKHLTYLGDATLGAHVNIGAGTITANYDGTNKHATAIADGASTGSNTVLVAPVKLGKGSKTGAGAVVLHDVPAGAVVVGVPAVEKKAKKSSPGKVRKRA
jgi:bifunctional UDP-N-acetylglucosamine pyrophosphorylase/glucosamine-1-phosphate N-acetyltransferase